MLLHYNLEKSLILRQLVCFYAFPRNSHADPLFLSQPLEFAWSSCGRPHRIGEDSYNTDPFLVRALISYCALILNVA
jgi:hypothetical protein